MFTGIIEETGKVKGIRMQGDSFQLQIACKKVLEQTMPGDSIAVNGVCLTVTQLFADGYEADVMPETMHRTCFKELRTGSPVNLERAMSAQGRFGGHIVSGHIDGTGEIIKIETDENAVWYTIEAEQSLLRYIVEKGSIAMDGISLTVARLTEKGFCVSVIPHTRANTSLAQKKIGSLVNLECDIIGKYVERLMMGKREERPRESKITEAFLIENGF